MSNLSTLAPGKGLSIRLSKTPLLRDFEYPSDLELSFEDSNA